MKKNYAFIALIVLCSSVLMTNCKNTGGFGEAQKSAVADTINQLMAKVTHYAEEAKVDSMFQWLSDDSASVFMTGGMAYSSREVNSLFGNEYKKIKSQQMEPLSRRVIVFSPDAAAWIGILKTKSISSEENVTEMFLVETWLWQRKPAGWEVVHYHESWMMLPDACKRATVEYALSDLAKELRGKAVKPADMPAILTGFLKQNPLIYGSTLAFAPVGTGGSAHFAAPYIYRQGTEYKQVDLPGSYDYTQSEWYAEPVIQKKPTWSNPYYDNGGGGVVMVTYSIPLYDVQNNLIGVLTSDIQLN